MDQTSKWLAIWANENATDVTRLARLKYPNLFCPHAV